MRIGNVITSSTRYDPDLEGPSCYNPANLPHPAPLPQPNHNHYSNLFNGKRLKQQIPFTDNDECAMKNGGCSHDCTNTVGSYDCSCPDAELALDEDKHTCEGKHMNKNTIAFYLKPTADIKV